MLALVPLRSPAKCLLREVTQPLVFAGEQALTALQLGPMLVMRGMFEKNLNAVQVRSNWNRRATLVVKVTWMSCEAVFAQSDLEIAHGSLSLAPMPTQLIIIV